MPTCQVSVTAREAALVPERVSSMFAGRAEVSSDVPMGGDSDDERPPDNRKVNILVVNNKNNSSSSSSSTLLFHR